MTMTPWAEQPALPPGAPQKPPEKEPFDFTWPWEPEHWERVSKEAGFPGWVEPALRGGWTGGLATLGALTPARILGLGGLAGQVATKPGMPAALAKLGSMATKLPSWLTTTAGGLTAYTAGQTPAPTPSPALGPDYYGPGYTPTGGMPEVPTPPTLPMPGEGMEGAGPEAQPQVIEVGGQQFWWDPTGGIYGTGGWSLIPAARLTPEQQLAEAQRERMARSVQGTAERSAQRRLLQEQYAGEQQLMAQQAEMGRQSQAEMAAQQRQQQEAAAAQQMAQMYAADPYKYWAQMGGGTPEAVARLTGGQVAPGEQMGQVPLSTPSAQWWGGLLPSEQQQIAGGLNWMGVDPQDWYSMYQRMIPGLGQRQAGPQWAR